MLLNYYSEKLKYLRYDYKTVYSIRLITRSYTSHISRSGFGVCQNVEPTLVGETRDGCSGGV